jgi:hypothetical protein
MENAVFEPPNIRRRFDGSIDIDHRQAALTERRLVMTKFLRSRKKTHRDVVAILLLAANVAPSRDGSGWNEASSIGAGHNSAMLQPLPTAARLWAMGMSQ